MGRYQEAVDSNRKPFALKETSKPSPRPASLKKVTDATQEGEDQSCTSKPRASQIRKKEGEEERGSGSVALALLTGRRYLTREPAVHF